MCMAVQGGMGIPGCKCTALSPLNDQRPKPHVKLKKNKTNRRRRH